MGTFVKDLDGAMTVPDEKSIAVLYDLLDSEGLYLGASSALNVVAAVELAQKLGPGTSHQILTPHRDVGVILSSRQDNSDNSMRWCISVPESIVLKGVVEGERVGGSYPRAFEEVCCIGVNGFIAFFRSLLFTSHLYLVEATRKDMAISCVRPLLDSPVPLRTGC